jgi:hypothetical protein
MSTEIIPDSTDGIPTPWFSSYPEELGNSWIHNCFMEDHPSIGLVSCVYFNDKYPKGTVIFSRHILNDYPDMYITWDKKYLANRMYTNPIHRRKGYWKFVGVLLRCLMYGYNRTVVDGSDDRAFAIEKAYLKMMSFGQKKWLPNNGRMLKHKGWEIQPPREPAYPYIWYNQRIGGKIND